MASMYGIFAYMYQKHQPNVGKYAIHGWHGFESNMDFQRRTCCEKSREGGCWWGMLIWPWALVLRTTLHTSFRVTCKVVLLASISLKV